MNLFNMTVKQEIKPRLEFRDPSSDELSDDTESMNSPNGKRSLLASLTNKNNQKSFSK
jgi:hypothetical protein